MHLVWFRRLVLTLGIVFLGLYPRSLACNVPAFRYALERWPSDPYQVVVYYQTRPLGPEFESLEKNAAGREAKANYLVKTVDVTTPEGKVLAEKRRIATFPWIEVFYPAQLPATGPVWSGPLEAERIQRILVSPARSQLVQALLEGEVAVWVLIRSGHDDKDRRAIEVLRTNLERASATLKIPEIGTDLYGNPVEVQEFKTYPVHFQLMQVARDDPDEELLVKALLKSEPDLEYYDEPIAFPVFGQGRALYALVGDGIQEENILEACQSLLNWCSCEIKAQTPGTDLLISADWSHPYGGKMVEDPNLPLEGLAGFIETETDTKTPAPEPVPEQAVEACPISPAPIITAAAVPISTPERAPLTTPARDPITRNILYLAGAAGFVLVALSVMLTIKRKRQEGKLRGSGT